MPDLLRAGVTGRSGTSLVEVIVSIVLLGLSVTLTVRVLSGAARSLDEAELGFREMVRLAHPEDEAYPSPLP
jgi:hypothetical protein